MFLKNTWYVAAWDYELEALGPIGRQIIGEAVAVYRRQDGGLMAVADRCPHRHAALSMGRVLGDDLQCGYHGLRFGPSGKCVHVPGMERIPPNLELRHYPVVEKDSWIWVWMGDPAAADPNLIPHGWGLNNDDWAMTSNQLDYEASYQLINDNLTDLSHLDFVHETTLGYASGAVWSEDRPQIIALERSLQISRWFLNTAPPGFAVGIRQDVYCTYTFTVPGIFIMRTDGFEPGTAKASGFAAPDLSLSQSTRVEQQAVTPIDAHRSRYLFASGMSGSAARAMPEIKEKMFGVIQAAFREDKAMIERQQRVHELTPTGMPMRAIAQDRGPLLMRSIIERLIKAENPELVSAE